MNQDDLVDARRAAIHVLCSAQAQEIISVEVFELRLALLNEAPTPAAMEAIVADLDAGMAVVPAFATGAYLDWPADQEPLPPLRMQAVLSGNRRTGRFDVPADLELKAMFGELQLDLRDAAFMSAEVHVHVDAFCGTILVTVPYGTAVTNECSTFMGSATFKVDPAPLDEVNGVHVRFEGSVVMGELKVRARPPSHLVPAPKRRLKGWLAKLAED